MLINNDAFHVSNMLKTLKQSNIEPGTQDSLLKKKILELEYEIIQLKNKLAEKEKTILMAKGYIRILNK